MSSARNFAIGLAKARNNFSTIQEQVNKAYPDNGMSRATIYRIIKTVSAGGDAQDGRQRGNNSGKGKRINLVSPIKRIVAENPRITVRELSERFDIARRTVERILKNELGLSKKTARWVPKLLTDEQRAERVRCGNLFMEAVEQNVGFLDKVVTMDETNISFFTPESKEQSKRWVKKGSPAPIKAKVQESRKKQAMCAFFDAEGMIYAHFVPLGQTVTAAYLVESVLPVFLKQLRRKRPSKVDNGWIFHWDNCSSHKAQKTRSWLAAHKIQLLEHPPYSPDLAPADFFLFRCVKTALGGVRINEPTAHVAWERAVKTIGKEEFRGAFNNWLVRYRKCVEKEGHYVEK